MSDQRLAGIGKYLMDCAAGKIEPLPPTEGNGGYVIPEVYVRPFKHWASVWDRRDRKKRRRWQHQKRKQ